MIGSLSPFHWIIILVALVLIFGGRGKISGLMGDAAKGIKAFREGLKEEEPKGETPVQPSTLPPVVERDEVKR